MEPSVVALLTLSLVTIAMHAIEYAWVWIQVNKRGPRRTTANTHAVLDDRLPKFKAEILAELSKTVADANAAVMKAIEESKPKRGGLMNGGLDPTMLVDRREYVKAEKQARIDAGRAGVLSWLVGNYGEDWGGRIMAFVDQQKILGEGLLLGGDKIWMPIVTKIANSFMQGKSLKPEADTSSSAAYMRG